MDPLQTQDDYALDLWEAMMKQDSFVVRAFGGYERSRLGGRQG